MDAAAEPRDESLKGILLTNVVTLVIALWQEWTVLQLMWPFWMQSVIIGWYARRRILKLREFCTEGLRINDRAVAPTPETQRRVANFFVLHFGGFHLGYLVFLVSMSGSASAGGVHPLDFVAYAGLAFGFWRSHGASHLEHVGADLGNVPNLGTLMMLPYARIVPMHLTLLCALPAGGAALWLFTLLKIAADLIMHKVEHRLLRRSGRPAGGDAAIE